ncbi:transcription antitermination factor NusB [Alloscardovia omnicolens]
MARSTARKRALNTLFEADLRGQEFTDLLDQRIAYPGAQTPLPDYAIEIVQGVASHRRTLDKALGDALESWEVKRMPAIDRNLARMAAWEIVYNDEIPAGVAINEAIALAKTYAGDDTPDLLYGVLSTVEKKAEDIRTEEIEWQQQRAAEAAEAEAAEAAAQAEHDSDDSVSDGNSHADADTISTVQASDASDASDGEEESGKSLSDLSFTDFNTDNSIDNVFETHSSSADISSAEDDTDKALHSDN